MYIKISDEMEKLIVKAQAKDVLEELRQIADLLGYRSVFEQSAKEPIIIPKLSLDHLGFHISEYNKALIILKSVE